jgi:hypothetical protein
MVCIWVGGTPLPPGGGLGAGDVDTLAEFIGALQALDGTGGLEVQPGQRAGPVTAYDVVARALTSAAQIPSRPTLAVECRHCPIRVEGLGALR